MTELGERLLQEVIRDLAGDVTAMQAYILSLEEGRTQSELLRLRRRVAPSRRWAASTPATEVSRGD